jgi:hypothetical protein
MKKRGKELIDLSDDDKHAILDKLITISDKYGMKLKACCTSGLLGYKNKVFESHCIDGAKIEKLVGGHLAKNAKDKGQRKECNCVLSRDVGSYTYKCNHSCDYCYANPT